MATLDLKEFGQPWKKKRLKEKLGKPIGSSTKLRG